MLKHGVDSNLSDESLEQGKTGKCIVMITPDADRTMNTFLGITGNIGYEQVNEEALSASQFLYIEGYLSSSPIALNAAVKAMEFARTNRVKTAFSLSDPNMVRFCRDGLERIIGEGVDILFCNKDEATMYTHQEDAEKAADSLRNIAKTVVITLGADGALVVSENELVRISGNPVKAIDTNGAGDLFAGSFLHALSKGHDLLEAGQLASFASAQLVTQYGPRLSDEKLHQVKQFAADI